MRSHVDCQTHLCPLLILLFLNFWAAFGGEQSTNRLVVNTFAVQDKL